MEKLWTTSEVAVCLGIQDADVEQLVHEGHLTGYKLGGQFVRFRPDEVQALKGKVRFRPQAKSHGAHGRSWWEQARDFAYFHDFYVISAVLLAVLVIYLIAST